MIFVDFLGDATTFRAVCEPLRSELAQLLRVGPEAVVVRRVVTEGGAGELELWVELSSEDDGDAVLAELGRQLAEAHEGLRFGVVRAEPGSLPRFELKAKRLTDEREVWGGTGERKEM